MPGQDFTIAEYLMDAQKEALEVLEAKKEALESAKQRIADYKKQLNDPDMQVRREMAKNTIPPKGFDEEEQIKDTVRIINETRDSVHWAIRRSCKQLQHTHKKIGDYPDKEFENVDPPYRHIRTLVGTINEGLEVLDWMCEIEDAVEGK